MCRNNPYCTDVAVVRLRQVQAVLTKWVGRACEKKRGDGRRRRAHSLHVTNYIQHKRQRKRTTDDRAQSEPSSRSNCEHGEPKWKTRPASRTSPRTAVGSLLTTTPRSCWLHAPPAGALFRPHPCVVGRQCVVYSVFLHCWFVVDGAGRAPVIELWFFFVAVVLAVGHGCRPRRAAGLRAVAPASSVRLPPQLA